MGRGARERASVSCRGARGTEVPDNLKWAIGVLFRYVRARCAKSPVSKRHLPTLTAPRRTYVSRTSRLLEKTLQGTTTCSTTR